jgi:hypothetical protein
MADYYPLISRAVGALEKNSGENRRAIYDRARAALLAQLRGVTPPLDESDITRERLALEESIRKVEAESARQFVEAARQMPAAKVRQFRQWDTSSKARSTETRPAEPRRSDEADAQEARQQHYAVPPPVASPEGAPASQEPPRRAGPAPPRSMPDAEQSDSIFDRPLPPQPQPVIPSPPETSPPAAGERRSLFSAFRRTPLGQLGGVQAEKSERVGDDAARAPTSDLDHGPRPYDGSQFDGSEPRRFEQTTAEERMFAPKARQERIFEPQEADEAHPRADFSQPMLEPSFTVDDSHPLAPDQHAASEGIAEEYAYDEFEDDVAPRRSYRGLIKGLAAAAVGIVIIGIGVWQWPNMVALYRSFRTPAVDTARDVPPPAATRPKITDRIEPGSPQTAAAPPAGTQPGVMAAQKVVLYEEDPADPNGKRFVGSAIWRTETVTPGPGQPPELAIRADVEVPERKLAMTWSLRRNTDKGLPATHTVEIMFKVPPDFPAGGISNVPGILMKQAEQTRGVPLAGLAVKVTPGFYLIGLSNVDADKDRNIQMLKERSWFDIPVVYNNNRRAILALEKGTPGERVFADAFKAWKQ